MCQEPKEKGGKEKRKRERQGEITLNTLDEANGGMTSSHRRDEKEVNAAIHSEKTVSRK